MTKIQFRQTRLSPRTTSEVASLSANGPADPPKHVGETNTEQVHLRLRKNDATLLRQLARLRDQTLSATVSFLIRDHIRARQVRNS